MIELYQEEYSGPEGEVPLVILHGLFGSGTNWRSIAKRLSQRRTVIVMDLRNHGRSPHHHDMNYELMAEDVMFSLQQQGISEADLLGHSMGGKTAMVCALRYSHRVNRLIVVDIAPANYQHTHQPLINAMQSLDLSSLQSRKQADERLSEVIEESSLRLFLLHNLEQVDQVYRWRLNLDALNQHLSDIMAFPQLDTPQYLSKSLFIYGQRSDYVTEGHHIVIEQYFPKAQYIGLDTGHWVQAEQPNQLIECVNEFLQTAC